MPPPVQFSVRARYDWELCRYSPFGQAAPLNAALIHASRFQSPSHRLSRQTGRLRFENPRLYDRTTASIGFSIPDPPPPTPPPAPPPAEDACNVTALRENLTTSKERVVSTRKLSPPRPRCEPRLLGLSFVQVLIWPELR